MFAVNEVIGDRAFTVFFQQKGGIGITTHTR